MSVLYFIYVYECITHVFQFICVLLNICFLPPAPDSLNLELKKIKNPMFPKTLSLIYRDQFNRLLVFIII